MAQYATSRPHQITPAALASLKQNDDEPLRAQCTKVSRQLNPELQQQLEAEILRNADLFAWSSADMPGINADFICHSIQYESCGIVKAQYLADFVAELTPTTAEEPQVWTLHVDGSSNSKGGGVGIILEEPNHVTLEQSLKFSFKVTNNQAEYEALLAGLTLARDLGARRVSCNSDSKLMVEQLSGMYQAKDNLLQRVLRAGYYWPTLKSDCQDYVQKCKECKQFGNTPVSTTQETPYRLTYGANAMILVEFRETSHRRQVFNSEQNARELAADLDFVDELRDEAQIHEEACKLQASRRYNTRVQPRSFRVGDLVWQLLGEAQKDTSDGKLAPTWGGPFRVTEDLENGAY
uniref:Uncharacterized protein Mb2253c family n=1 Tax=Cajanus cajan TaxID=3821 RepID=A0A151RTX0_CAJCA|nr:Uncharacterized protein Mb2253c family [Cajanus cajan]